MGNVLRLGHAGGGSGRSALLLVRAHSTEDSSVQMSPRMEISNAVMVRTSIPGLMNAPTALFWMRNAIFVCFDEI